MKKYLPTEDLLFKKMLSQKGNEDILARLIRVITKQNFKQLTVINPFTIETYRDYVDGNGRIERNRKIRTTIVDIAATTQEGVSITIEMQMYPKTALEKRFLFYMCNTYTENYPAKTEYDEDAYSALQPVICICVENFKIHQTEFVHTVSCFKDDKIDTAWKDKNGRYLLELHQISLVGTQLQEGDDPELLEWQKFLQDGTIGINSPEELKKAKQIIDETNLTGEEVALLDAQQKALADYYAERHYAHQTGFEEGYADGRSQGMAQGIEEGKKVGMEVGREEGRAEGIAEGRIEGRNLTILTLSETMSPEAIAAALKMPLEQVLTILDAQ